MITGFARSGPGRVRVFGPGPGRSGFWTGFCRQSWQSIQNVLVRSCHSPEKQRIAPKARCRGCGRNSKSSQWLQNVLVRSYHSPEKQRIAPKARFRGCGRNSTSSQWQIPPQPRKAKNCSKSSFSGLWTEFHKQPMTDPTTARKAHNCSKSSFSGLWTEFANDRSCHSPEKQRIAPKARLRGCGRNSTSSQWQILPQPRKAHNCAKSSFSGLWTEFHKQPMTDPTTASKSKQLLQKIVFGAVDGIPQAANDRSYHSPEKHTIAPKARFRGCGRNSTSSQWQIPPQPRKAKNCSKSSFSGLWTEFHKQPMTDPTTAPKSKELLQKLVFGAVDGIPQS